jgi:hypothetical protein
VAFGHLFTQAKKATLTLLSRLLPTWLFHARSDLLLSHLADSIQLLSGQVPLEVSLP